MNIREITRRKSGKSLESFVDKSVLLGQPVDAVIALSHAPESYYLKYFFVAEPFLTDKIKGFNLVCVCVNGEKRDKERMTDKADGTAYSVVLVILR